MTTPDKPEALRLAVYWESARALKAQHAEIERLTRELAEARALPAGWQLVPKEPTDDMVKAAFKLFEMPTFHGYPKLPRHVRRAIYRAMLAASPQPPRPQDATAKDTKRRPRDDEAFDAEDQDAP